MNKHDIAQGMVIEIAAAAGNPKEDALIAKIRHHEAGNDPCAEIALIRLGKSLTMPFNVRWQEFEARISDGTYTLTDRGPEALAFRSVNDLKEESRPAFTKIVDENKARLRPIMALGWGAFVSKTRGAEIVRVAAGDRGTPRCSPSWLRDILIRFWRSGENELALGPQYAACRGQTRAERRRLQVALKTVLKQTRRAGPSLKHLPRSESGFDPITALNEPGRGGCAIPVDAEPVIEDLIDLYLKDKGNRAMIDASLARWKALPWGEITNSVTRGLRDYPQFAGMEPSRRQIAYIGKKSADLLGTIRLVRGTRYSNLNHRALSGDYRDVSMFPGMRYEVDISKLDIHLVDDLTGMPIGRVHLIYVVDRYTGMIVGVYVTTDEVDYSHVARALHCAFSNKVEWCKNLGLEIAPGDWAPEGRSDETVADNAQLATKDGTRIAEYVTDIGLARPYRGDDKPAVEDAFSQTEHDFVHRFSYGVSRGPKERGRDDLSKDACVSVRSFTRELVRWVIYTHNHRTYPADRFLEPAFLKSRRKTTPFEYWNWAINKRGGRLKKYDAQTMMPRLLKRVDANMTERGIELEGLFFDRPDDNDFQEQKRLATCGGTRKVTVYYDELTTRLIYIESPDKAGQPTPCPIAHVSRESADLTFKEVRMHQAHRIGLQRHTVKHSKKQAEAQQNEQRNALAEDRAKIRSIHGGIKSRNKKALGLDKEFARKKQGKADNRANTNAIHGAQSPSGAAVGPSTQSTTTKTVRPSIYE